MGIQYLWTILAPYCERKPLYHLQGKTVAVDLSCWVCEAQNISEYEIQPRMYLRNLYFRTCYLLLMEVIPVFVLEGKAPELKYDTIAARNEIQFKGSKPKTEKTKSGKDRTRFHFILKRCEEMIGYMGLACVKGKGEAESMCAYLNCDGMVAGCISQDSDCFAYGAKVVFRNFSISSQGNQSASGGAVDVYDIEKAYEHLKFGRNKIITLALLCGSDYNDGVHGVGKESALKFMNRYSDEEILDRMRSWRYNNQKYKDLEDKIADKKICTSCGHKGTVQSHSKSGCFECTTTKGCDFRKYREERLELKNEISVRNKALADPNFPNEKLISEYLIRKDDVQKLNLKWKQPNLVAFVKFTNKYLGWEELYSFEKLLPIQTRWQILNYKYIKDCLEQGRLMDIKGTLQPDFIKKVRNPKGIPSYEIVWKDSKNYFEHLIPEEQLEKYKEMNQNFESLWSTIEPQNLVQTAYPELVEKFLESKTKKAKKGTTKRKKTNNVVNELTDMLGNTSISEPKVKKSRKKVAKKPEKMTLDNFLSINKEKSEKLCQKPKTIIEKLKKSEKTINASFDLDASNFGDENDTNISDIIDNIVSKSPKLSDKIKKLGYHFINQNFDSSSPIKKMANDNLVLKPQNFSSPVVKNRRSSFFGIQENGDIFEDILNKKELSDEENFETNTQDNDFENVSYSEKNDLMNQSSFFEPNFQEEQDLFEKSIHKDYLSGSESDGTLEYNYEERNLKKNSSSSEDEFCFEDLDVPLIERIKNLKK